MCAFQSPIFGGSITLQNELLQLLNDGPEIPQLSGGKDACDECGKDAGTCAATDAGKDVATDAGVDVTADDVIQDAVVSNPDMSGGRSISTMIDNVMSGGNANAISPESADSSKTLEEIYEYKDEMKGGDQANDNEEEETNEDEDDEQSSDDSSDDGDDADDVDDGDDGDDELDISSDFKNRYIKLINEFKEPVQKQSLHLVGGSKPSARRVKVINAFPYILKSAPTV